MAAHRLLIVVGNFGLENGSLQYIKGRNNNSRDKNNLKVDFRQRQAHIAHIVHQKMFQHSHCELFIPLGACKFKKPPNRFWCRLTSFFCSIYNSEFIKTRKRLGNQMKCGSERMATDVETVTINLVNAYRFIRAANRIS